MLLWLLYHSIPENIFLYGELQRVDFVCFCVLFKYLFSLVKWERNIWLQDPSCPLWNISALIASCVCQSRLAKIKEARPNQKSDTASVAGSKDARCDSSSSVLPASLTHLNSFHTAGGERNAPARVLTQSGLCVLLMCLANIWERSILRAAACA